MDHLSGLAQIVYLRYMTTGAHNAALGDINRPVEVYGNPRTPMEPQDEGAEKYGWNGDRQMANLTLWMRDSLWYHELCHAIVDGDTGRVLEIIKVTNVLVDYIIFLISSLALVIFILGSWSIQLWEGAPCTCSNVYPCLQ